MDGMVNATKWGETVQIFQLHKQILTLMVDVGQFNEIPCYENEVLCYENEAQKDATCCRISGHWCH